MGNPMPLGKLMAHTHSAQACQSEQMLSLRLIRRRKTTQKHKPSTSQSRWNENIDWEHAYRLSVQQKNLGVYNFFCYLYDHRCMTVAFAQFSSGRRGQSPRHGIRTEKNQVYCFKFVRRRRRSGSRKRRQQTQKVSLCSRQTSFREYSQCW